MTDPLMKTLQFLQKALPRPTERDQQVQLGVHIEEFNEMMNSLGFNDAVAEAMANNIRYYTKQLADHLKSPADAGLVVDDRLELLDSLCDQMVTATSVANTQGFRIYGALDEVGDSNLSKFVDGEPVFTEGGKIAKGPDYKAPNLVPFLNNFQ